MAWEVTNINTAHSLYHICHGLMLEQCNVTEINVLLKGPNAYA